MEKTDRNQRACKLQEADLFLKWGNRKRLRCVRARDNKDPQVSYGGTARIRRKILTFSDKNTSFLQPSNRSTRNSETGILRSENRRSAASPEKEDKYYTTRGSVVGLEDNGNEKVTVDNNGVGGGGVVWPKICISLSSKEKEEDFMAMKGCKLPHRPKKRAKMIQRTILLVSPGAWLTDMCQERYEVREKKTSKKQQRARGLKAMGSVESDSE